VSVSHILKTLAVAVAIDFAIARLSKRPKVFYVNNLPFNYNAQTIPPLGIFVKKNQSNNNKLIEHELVHWEQYRRSGAIFYYAKYGIQKMIYGYDRMPMEIEARAKLGESDYCQTNYTKCVRNGNSSTISNAKFRS
jgi:hypothetical protein